MRLALSEYRMIFAPLLRVRPQLRYRRCAVAALLATVAGAVVAVAPPAVAAPSCSAFDRPVSDQLNPRTQAQLLTSSSSEVSSYRARGFTAPRGKPVTASAAAGAGLSGVHRLHRPSNGNFFYTADAAEAARAVRSGYRTEGIAFYASRTAASCLIPVYSFWRAGRHRFSTVPGEQAVLRDAGWTPEGVRFYLGRPQRDDTFTIGVIPDTQQEVLRANDRRFLNRSRWLVTSRAQLDLRFVTHTGDIVNWDSGDHVQYQRAARALEPLTAAGVPYSLSPGNHDTSAVCTGGGACDPAATRSLVRRTPSFNRYLSEGTGALRGRFEPGKMDNTFSTFAAGGSQWLVLNLELWPRLEVVNWARRMVAQHPDHNVVVVTHSYLTATGAIYTSGSYGGVSPRYLFDHLVKPYPNVRVVLSGHAGRAASRVDTGTNGNRIVSLMLTMHDNRTNPVRLVELNTAADTLNTWVHAPHTKTSYPALSKSFGGLDWR
jgi:hypothetical protein